MRYFKIIRGYGNDDFIPIDETELEKAIYAQIKGITAIFKNGSLIGSQISAIMPDFHRTMNWNYGHKMKLEDWEELKEKGLEKKYQGVVGLAKEKVQYLIETNQTNLIGKDFEMPKIEKKVYAKEVDALAEKMRIQ